MTHAGHSKELKQDPLPLSHAIFIGLAGAAMIVSSFRWEWLGFFK